MIKFLNLNAIIQSFEPELSNAIKKVIDSGWYLLGNEVKSFENNYRKFIGTKHCIGVGNGLDALRLIIRGYLELGIFAEGDEIIVPANTYIATILSITDNRLKPVFVEPDISTYNIDPFKIEEKITKKTKGIMIVHLYGQNAMHTEIERLVKKYELKLFEDNAQSTGAFFENKRTGSLGDAAGHSFYPGKNLGALGDGGAITTNDDQLAVVVRGLANYGSNKKYNNDYKGLNSRLDEIQAAVLDIKLKRLDTDNNNRREIANYYIKKIKNNNIILPKPLGSKNNHVWHLFVIRTKNRNHLQEYLLKNGIQTIIHYPIPFHKQLAYKEFSNLSFPITEVIHEEVLSLPLDQTKKRVELDTVIKVINEY